MTEFKVGDKVQVFGGTPGEVVYGPFRSTFGTYNGYVVRTGDGSEVLYKETDMTAEPVAPVFTVGDKVHHEGTLAEIVGGPVVGRMTGEDLFLLKFLEGSDAGKGAARTAGQLEPTKAETALVPVGTRVRIDRAKHAEETHGRTAVVTSNTETWREYRDDVHVYRVRLDDRFDFYAAEVTPVDEVADTFEYDGNGFEYDGVIYEYGVEYTDIDNDPWTFKRSPIHGQPVSDETSAFVNESLGAVVRNYGPLTKQ
ncbi:phiSA1p31-related protein [Streptomyces sp. IBSNAI001]|uniref:phiSA1p31-related protein n=1 Tax=Streptomyces sp. IBSNAI001 TaxID=3457499 RepID=UPI003FD604E6